MTRPVSFAARSPVAIVRAGVVAVLLGAVAGCASTPDSAADTTALSPTTDLPSTTDRPSTTRPPTTSAVSPTTTSARAADGNVTPGSLGASWRPGCPVGPESLVSVVVDYVNFGGDEVSGELIVAGSVAADIEAIFAELLDARFPIRLVSPVANFGASDQASMSYDNTSAFNCRNVSGTSTWSKHSYGIAIDINPLENPWVRSDGRTDPPQSATYRDRALGEAGMVTASGPVVAAFDRRGWTWGGRWSEPDYQHFVKE